jgi:predicted metal-dependent phosphoesterase TrpH
LPALKIDLHVHTNYSNDAKTTINEVVQYAQKQGLDGVAITDHDTVLGARKLARQKQFMIIPGIEVSSRQGHVLGLNIDEPIPPKLDITETTEKIRQLGGVAVIAHPSVVIKTGLGIKITSSSDIDAVEVINSSAFPFSLSTYLARRLAKRLGLPQTAGSDAHYPKEIGSAYTCVEANSNPNDVIEAIRKGKTDPLGKPISTMLRIERGLEGLRETLRGL